MQHSNIVATEKLLNLINSSKNKMFEVCLLLNYNGKATHFISTKKSLILDEGIDGQLVKWKQKDFFEHYKNSQWIIDQIV